jgi:hypothetical protein
LSIKHEFVSVDQKAGWGEPLHVLGTRGDVERQGTVATDEVVMVRLSTPFVADQGARQLDGVQPPVFRKGLDVAVYRRDAERRHEHPARRKDLVGAQRPSFTRENLTYGPPLSGVALHSSVHSFEKIGSILLIIGYRLTIIKPESRELAFGA